MEKSLANLLGKEAENINQKVKGDIKFNSEQEIDEYLKNEFPDIIPSMEDLYIGKLEAYRRAAVIKLEKEKEEKRKLRLQQTLRMWTAEEMYDKAIEMGNAIALHEKFKNGFVIDDNNRHVFKLLCLYFTNNPEFETHEMNGLKYSLQKGIWLQSSVRGSGKSTLLKCFQFNKRCCFGYKHTTELANIYQKKGFDGIDFFIGTIPQPSNAMNFYQHESGFVYDELFGENKSNFMGNPVMVSEYIINRLYDFSDNKKGEMWKFHCTSNATGEDIEQISGATYRSRMPDMFNLIKLEGPNRRLL